MTPRHKHMVLLSAQSWLALLVVLLTAQGCSSRAWFEGLKERERSRCYQQVSNDAVESCLKQVEAMSYDQYKRSIEK